MAFVLEVPPCANEPLVGYSPTQGVNLNADPVIFPSIRWNTSTNSGTTIDQTYSYTIGGVVKEGIVQVGIKLSGGGIYSTITGPSKLFDISGTAYTDANKNGLFDANEAGIPNVSVTLFNTSNALVGTVSSDGSGHYVFQNILCGTYTVQLDTNTLTNQTKNTYFLATSALKYTVSIGPDSPNNNFGFTPQTQKLLNDIGRVLPTNGASAGVWKKQFQAAISGTGRPVVSRDTLLAYLSRINNLALANPFQFSLDNVGLQKALDILSNGSKTELSNLLQQLLTTELNYERGLGLTDQSLQLVLIGWGESLGVGAGAASVSSVSPAAAGTAKTDVAIATDIFGTINSGGGGGGLQ
jgi:hypothetical protein